MMYFGMMQETVDKHTKDLEKIRIKREKEIKDIAITFAYSAKELKVLKALKDSINKEQKKEDMSELSFRDLKFGAMNSQEWYMKMIKDMCEAHKDAVNKKEDMSDIKEVSYSAEQLMEHGDIILKYIKDPSLEIEARLLSQNPNSWNLMTEPTFDSGVGLKYRIKPKLIYTNSLGEKFYEGHIGHCVSFNSAGLSEIISFKLGNKGGSLSLDFPIGKTKESAYKLAFEQLLKESKQKK